MRFRACIALLLYVSACATSAPSQEEPVGRDPRFAKLERAAALPWTDGGRCVVQEASQPWPMLAERCYHALDHDRVEFHDLTGRCAVASAGVVVVELGVCVLAVPEIVVGAVVVTGVVVVGFAIQEALEAYELRRDRPKCEPDPVPYHLGGNKLHDLCADRIPNNSFPGGDVFVNGKNFDALQLAARTLWEVKINAIETYNPYIRRIELEKQVEEARHERDLAAACGFHFRVGVRSEAHKAALERLDRTLDIVVMDWC